MSREERVEMSANRERKSRVRVRGESREAVRV